MASAGAVDSQTVPGASTVDQATGGYDGAKKVNGRKRHLVVDTWAAGRGGRDRGQRAGP